MMPVDTFNDAHLLGDKFKDILPWKTDEKDSDKHQLFL